MGFSDRFRQAHIIFCMLCAVSHTVGYQVQYCSVWQAGALVGRQEVVGYSEAVINFSLARSRWISLATGRGTLLISFHHRRSASAWAMPNSTLEQQCAEVSGRASKGLL